MSREDIEEHIESVLDGEETVEAKLHCQNCGSELNGDDYVLWEIGATPAAGLDGSTLHFCDEECLDDHKQGIIHGR